jgi:hypothetical protein
MNAPVLHRALGTESDLKRAAIWPLAVACFASALVFYGLSRPHALTGVVQYDDGVYFDSALRLVTGQVPYRDFTFVQPPGITLLFSPIALIARHIGTRDGLAIARCLTALVAGANAYLAGRLVRHRGAITATVAAAIVALYPAAVFADRTLLLEPYLVLFALLGARSCFSHGDIASLRHLMIAGIYLGIATVTKSWAILIVFALVVVIFTEANTNALQRTKAAAALVASTLVTIGLICLPFIVAAPESFFHDVIWAQLHRQTGANAPLWVRLSDIVGIDGSNAGSTPLLAYLIAAAIAAVLIAGTLVPILRRQCSAVERFLFLAALITTAALLIPSEYFNHYPYFVAPFLSGALVCAGGRILQAIRPRVRVTASLHRAVAIVGLVGLLAGGLSLVAGEARFDNALLQSTGDPSLAIDLAIPTGSCAISDAMILLVEANRTSDGVPNCPALVDATGIWLATAPTERPLGCAPLDPTLVSNWQQLLSQADFFVESGSAQSRVPWTVGLKSWFSANFRHVPDPGAQVFVRIGTPYAHAVLDPGRWTLSRLAAEGWHPAKRTGPTHRVNLPACLASRV